MKRRSLQGVWTVLRFNWHLHVLGLVLVALLLGGAAMVSGVWGQVLSLAGVCAAGALMVPVVATWYAYDATGLYDLSWLARWVHAGGEGANIHAGFDETTVLLEVGYPEVKWRVFDFFDPTKHTEVSIRRARKFQPAHPNVVAVQSTLIPMGSGSLDYVVLMLAAHEVRDRVERVEFFRELARVLAGNGKVFVIEHLRDWANIACYSIGAWHFHSRREWLETFEAAGFHVREEFRLNLLITAFVLTKREDAP